MKRLPLVCLIVFGVSAGLLGPAGPARAVSPETRARAALALVQATARVKATATAPAAEAPPAPAPAVKQCPCSNLCTCGCVQGRPCLCRPATTAPVVRPDLPTVPAPVAIPIRRSRGGC